MYLANEWTACLKPSTSGLCINMGLSSLLLFSLINTVAATPVSEYSFVNDNLPISTNVNQQKAFNPFLPQWSDSNFYEFISHGDLSSCESVVVTAGDNFVHVKKLIQDMTRTYTSIHDKHCYSYMKCKDEYKHVCKNPHFWRYIAFAAFTSSTLPIVPNIKYLLYMDSDAVITDTRMSIPELAKRFMHPKDRLWITGDFLCDNSELPINNGVLLFQIPDRESLDWVHSLSLSVIANKDLKQIFSKQKRFLAQYLVDQPIFTHTLVDSGYVYPLEVSRFCKKMKDSWTREMKSIITANSLPGESRTLHDFVSIIASRTSLAGSILNFHDAVHKLNADNSKFKRWWFNNVALNPLSTYVHGDVANINSVMNVLKLTPNKRDPIFGHYMLARPSSFTCTKLTSLIDYGTCWKGGYLFPNDVETDAGWVIDHSDGAKESDLVADARWDGLKPSTFPHKVDEDLVMFRRNGVVHTLPMTLNGGMRLTGALDVPGSQWRWDQSFVMHLSGIPDSFRAVYIRFACLLLDSAGRGNVCAPFKSKIRELAPDEAFARVVKRSLNEQLPSVLNIIALGQNFIQYRNEELQSNLVSSSKSINEIGHIKTAINNLHQISSLILNSGVKELDHLPSPLACTSNSMQQSVSASEVCVQAAAYGVRSANNNTSLLAYIPHGSAVGTGLGSSTFWASIIDRFGFGHVAGLFSLDDFVSELVGALTPEFSLKQPILLDALTSAAFSSSERGIDLENSIHNHQVNSMLAEYHVKKVFKFHQMDVFDTALGLKADRLEALVLKAETLSGHHKHLLNNMKKKNIFDLDNCVRTMSVSGGNK